jgi:hypothetical protein
MSEPRVYGVLFNEPDKEKAIDDLFHLEPWIQGSPPLPEEFIQRGEIDGERTLTITIYCCQDRQTFTQEAFPREDLVCGCGKGWVVKYE